LRLCPHEIRVIRSLLAGNTRTKDIAWDLKRSTGGVKVVLSNIYTKLGLHDLTGLALWAMRNQHLLSQTQKESIDMSQSNVAALDSMFAPPPTPAGVPTTQQMQQTAMLAKVKAKMALDYATIHLKRVQAEQATVDAEINSNPATASAALRKQQEELQAKAQGFSNVIDNQYPDYVDGVNAWYANMTSGSKYVPLDQWTDTQPSSYPNLFACESQVTF